MLVEKTIKDFLAETASDSPAPGGGSVAALSAALAASLGTMVCNLTIGKDQYVKVQQEVVKLKEKLTNYMNRSTDLVDLDANAFNDVMAGFKLPKETEDQKKARSDAIQSGYKKAIAVPLDTARIAVECLKALEPLVEKGNQNAITDGGTGALMALAATRGAILNIKINLSKVKDLEYAKNVKEEIHSLENGALVLTDRIMKKIVSLIGS